MKAWTMLLFWLIRKPQSLKQFRKFKWENTFLRLGITLPIQFTITMETVFTYVNSA
jgi:hypothetical protein